MNVTLEVKQVVVIESKGRKDSIHIILNYPTPFPSMSYSSCQGATISPTFVMEVEEHYGKIYCENILGIPVDEVISVR